MTVSTPDTSSRSIAAVSVRSRSASPRKVASGMISRSARPSWPSAPMTTVRSGGTGCTSASRGWSRSLSETSVSGSGHGTASVGSCRWTNV